MQTLKTILALFFLIISHSIFGQYTEVINSNRPGVSQSAFALGTNVAQLELGGFSVNEKHTPLNYEVSGFGLGFSLRYGLILEQLELSIDGVYQNDKKTNFNNSIPQEDARANFKNLTIGAKYLVYDPYKNAEEEKPDLYSYHSNRAFKWKSLIPAVAIYAGANFNTKDNPFIADGLSGISPKFIIATQNNFSGGWVFVTNFIFNHLFTPIQDEAFYKASYGDDYSISEFQYIFTLTHSFSPQWVIFGEAQGIKSDFYADNLYRFGGAYLWSKDFQLDTNITFNTKDTPSVFNIAFGASYRLDFHEDKKIDHNSSAKEERKRRNKHRKKKKKKKRKKEEGRKKK